MFNNIVSRCILHYGHELLLIIYIIASNVSGLRHRFRRICFIIQVYPLVDSRMNLNELVCIQSSWTNYSFKKFVKGSIIIESKPMTTDETFKVGLVVFFLIEVTNYLKWLLPLVVFNVKGVFSFFIPFENLSRWFQSCEFNKIKSKALKTKPSPALLFLEQWPC